MKYILLFIIIGSFYVRSSAQIEVRDSLAMEYLFKAEKYYEKNNHKKASKYFILAYETNRKNEIIHQKGLAYFLERENYDVAKKFFSLVGIPSTAYNRKARVFYNHGLMLMKAGRTRLFESEAVFETALSNIKKAEYPNLELYSQILVARGFTKILSRPIKNKGDEYNFILIHTKEALMALNYFETALKINPDLEIAIKNRDIILKWLEHCNIEPPTDNSLIITENDTIDLKNQFPNLDKNLDIMDSLRQLVYSSLPDNIEQITNHLNRYDEVILVIDVSGSMNAPMVYNSALTRFIVMKELTQAILTKVDKKVKIGVLTVGGGCSDYPLINIPIDDITKRVLIEKKVEWLELNGATPLNRRVDRTTGMFSNKENKKTILLMSDGMDTCNETFDLCNTAIKLDNNNIDVSVFSFLLEGQNFQDDIAYEIYECMTAHSGGKIFFLNNESKIQEKEMEINEEEVYFELPDGAILSTLYPNHDCMYELAMDKNSKYVPEKLDKKK